MRGYAHDTWCGASLVLLLQSALRSQGLAAGCDEADPVLELFWKHWAFDLLFADKLDDALRAAVHHVLPAEHDGRDEAISLGHKALLHVKRLLVPSHYFGPNLKSLTEGQGAPVPDGGGPYHHSGPQFV